MDLPYVMHYVIPKISFVLYGYFKLMFMPTLHVNMNDPVSAAIHVKLFVQNMLWRSIALHRLTVIEIGLNSHHMTMGTKHSNAIVDVINCTSTVCQNYIKQELLLLNSIMQSSDCLHGVSIYLYLCCYLGMSYLSLVKPNKIMLLTIDKLGVYSLCI